MAPDTPSPNAPIIMRPTQKLVLVGNPHAWDSDEQNELIGDEITIFLAEERILVQGARVRFHPNESPDGES